MVGEGVRGKINLIFDHLTPLRFLFEFIGGLYKPLIIVNPLTADSQQPELGLTAAVKAPTLRLRNLTAKFSSSISSVPNGWLYRRAVHWLPVLPRVRG